MAAQDAVLRASSAVPSCPPFELIALNRPAVAARSALKAVAFNAGGGANVDGIASRLSRPPLADAGTILLCEASWRMPRHAQVKLASELAAALGMSFAFIPCFGRLDRGGEIRAVGNAILCAQPLDELRVVLLPNHQPRFTGYRMPGVPAGLAARISIVGRRLALAVVHLERRWDPVGRALQMERFLDALGADAPAVIGGDLNTTTVDMDGRWALAQAGAALLLSPRRFQDPRPYEPLFGRLHERGFSIDGANVPRAPTFTPSRLVPPLWRPKLDWLAARGLAPVEGSAAVVPAHTSGFGRRVSDHDFVVCEFRL
jgi:endonuclease/exonuclease/phosphatase family metal-dependent hydrolase